MALKNDIINTIQVVLDSGLSGLLSAGKKTIWHRYSNVISPKYGKNAIRNRFSDAKKLLDTEAPTIVDGGSYQGSVIDQFVSYFNRPTIHGFEPMPDMAEHLRQKYDDNPQIFIHECALGPENGSIEFNILNNRYSSSIYSPTELKSGYYDKAVDRQERIEVPQVRLDSVLDEEIDVIKLDLQGYELEAMKGAGDLFDSAKIIITEVEFVPLYEDQALFADVDQYLRDKGFQLFNLYELNTEEDGQLDWADALYYNKNKVNIDNNS